MDAMTANSTHFDELERRLRTILPEVYRDRVGEVKPVSMGSAGLKFDADGNVAWDQIWGSFCDLAMAGGPPHRGKLLLPGSPEQIEDEPDRYHEVVAEICRGISLVTGLHAEPHTPGWIRMYCTSAGMAGWLARAIVMENVSASFKGLQLHLPAGPAYRLEKEIKNVVTAVAKTCHYWLDHTSPEEQDAISAMLMKMERESPLLQPGSVDNQPLRGVAVSAIAHQTGLHPADRQHAGWLGIACGSISAAIWMMRLLTVSNALSHREEESVYAPLDPVRDPEGEIVVRIFVQAHAFAASRGVFEQTHAKHSS